MKLTDVTNSMNGLNKSSLLSSMGIENNAPENLQSNTNNDSFSNILQQSINEVNENQVNAYGAMKDIATGKVENLQEAVKTIEEAELSLKLSLEVKNKALGAYKQIMAMQI